MDLLTPLQYSCLENPMDGGGWWAAVHGVARSQTRLSDVTFTFTHWRRKWQPTPVFLPGESQGWRSLVGCHLWGRTELDMTEAIQQQQQQQQLVNLAWITIGKKLVTQLPLGRKYWEREEQEQGKSYFTFHTLLKHLNFVICIACLRINSCEGKQVSVNMKIKYGVLFFF